MATAGVIVASAVSIMSADSTAAKARRSCNSVPYNAAVRVAVQCLTVGNQGESSALNIGHTRGKATIH